MDDMLWNAALKWWSEKVRTDSAKAEASKLGIGSSMMAYAEHPTIGCETPAEKALALAIAARMQLFWIKDQ